MNIIVSKLDQLIGAKEAREQRTLSIRTIAAEAGTSRSTVERLLNNTMKRYPSDDLAALCTYLNCTLGDLLVLMDEADHLKIGWFGPPPGMDLPPIVRHPPYVGFRDTELGGYIWTRCENFHKAENQGDEITRVSVWTDSERNASRTIQSIASVAEIQRIVAQTRQITQQTRLDQRSVRPPRATVGMTEAREWLNASNKIDFATNRFHEPKNALTFVEQLYEAGMLYIAVIGESHTTFETYADTLYIKIPSQLANSLYILQELNHEVEHGGALILADKRSHAFEMWWD